MDKKQERRKTNNLNETYKNTCKRKKMKKKKKKKNNLSLPSLRERSETPGALDRRDWESQEANPLPRTVLSALVHITSYWRSDCRQGRQESIMCTERPKPRLDYWGGKCSEPQSASEHVRHLNFPSKLCSYSIFKE